MPLNTYLITTKSKDHEKIRGIQDRFSRSGFDLTIIDGINGAAMEAADYFQRTQPWRFLTGYMMTPGELGCVLSHQKALRLASESPKGIHLFLEDDFQASDEALTWILDVSKRLPRKTFLLLGGQEGMRRVYRCVRAAPVDSLQDVAEVNPADLEYLRRTVAYVVDSATAKALADLIDKGAFVMDDLRHAYNNHAFERLWFRWVVSHPLELSESSIEKERQAMRRPRWSLRSWVELTNRRKMQLGLIWRWMTTPSTGFLHNQQPENQLPE